MTRVGEVYIPASVLHRQRPPLGPRRDDFALAPLIRAEAVDQARRAVMSERLYLLAETLRNGRRWDVVRDDLAAICIAVGAIAETSTRARFVDRKVA